MEPIRLLAEGLTLERAVQDRLRGEVPRVDLVYTSLQACRPGGDHLYVTGWASVTSMVMRTGVDQCGTRQPGSQHDFSRLKMSELDRTIALLLRSAVRSIG